MPFQASERVAYVCAILEVGVLPDSSLLARGRGQAILQPEEDQPRQPQQLQRVLDERLYDHVAIFQSTVPLSTWCSPHHCLALHGALKRASAHRQKRAAGSAVMAHRVLMSCVNLHKEAHHSDS